MISPTSVGSNHFLDYALDYTNRGFSIIPVILKKAHRSWKEFQRRLPEKAEIQEWFKNPIVTGLAVIAGKVSGGLVIRDFDDLAAYQNWADTHTDLATMLPTVQTKRGRHVYLRSDHHKITKLADGELRGNGYCLLPPSQHPDGPTYRWLIPLPDGPIPKLDPIESGLAPPPIPPAPQHHIACRTGSSVSPRSMIDDAIRATLPTGPKERNQAIFRFAQILKFSGVELSPEERLQAMKEWHANALPFMATKDFGESWEDFKTAWVNVQRPRGVTLHGILAEALAKPEEPIDGRPELGILAAICRELAKVKAGPFPLSQYVAARLMTEALGMPVDPRQARRWLKDLVFFEKIRLHKKGKPGKKSKEASEWEFTG